MSSKPEKVVFNPPFEKQPATASPPAEKRAAAPATARRATGPKTPEGKARSSQNAVKHGLLAKAVVLKSAGVQESAEEFDELLADFTADLQPSGHMEEAIVERIATCQWRFARAYRYEASALEHATDHAGLAADVETIRAKLLHEQAELHRIEKLLAMSEKPPEALPAEQAKELADWEKELRATPAGILWEYGIPPELPHVLRSRQRTREKRIAELTSDLRAAEQRSDSAQLQHTLSAYIPEPAALLSVVRYESMLDRQIHRAVMELNRIRSMHGPRSGPRRHRNSEDEAEA